MTSKLIELGDEGILVEIEQIEGKPREIAGSAAERITDATIDRIQPILEKATRPILEVYRKINETYEDTEVREAEVELGLGFEAEGNLYITKSRGAANLVVRFRLGPKRS